MKQKLLALASALALCFSLAGCHTSTPDTVGSIGGEEISSGLYLLAQFDAYQQAAQYAGEDQDPANVKAFLKAEITPDGGEAVAVSNYVAEATQEELRRYAAVEARFAELGAELDPAYTAQADSYTDQLVENYGALYAANGIGEETIRHYEYNLAKQTALIDLVYGQDGETPLTDEELTDHLENEMLYLRYVTVPLYNTSTFAFADEDQTAEMLSLAEDAAASSTPDTFDETVAAALPGIYAVLDAELTAEDAAAQLSSSFLTRSQLTESFSEEAAATRRHLGRPRRRRCCRRRVRGHLPAHRSAARPARDPDPRHPARHHPLGYGRFPDRGRHGRRRRGPLRRAGPGRPLPKSKCQSNAPGGAGCPAFFYAFWASSSMKTKYSTFRPVCATIEPSERCTQRIEAERWQSNRRPGGISSAHSHPNLHSSTTTSSSARSGAGRTSSPCGTARW